MSNEEEYIIAITGHRDYPDRGALYRGLDDLRADHYYFGGARGTDTDALEYISRTQPGSTRTVVVPNRLIDQPKYCQEVIKQHASEVIELRNTGPDRYMIRNRYMVDHSDRTAAFYDYRGKGGTYNTIEYSRQTGKPLSLYTQWGYDYQEIAGMPRDEFLRFVDELRKHKVPLGAGKVLILRTLSEIHHISVGELAVELGCPGARNLEQIWSY